MWRLAGPAGAELLVENLREVQTAEADLLAQLPPFAGRVVIPHTGGSPLVPAAIAALNPEARVEVCELDMHDARLLREKLSPLKNIQVLCVADVVPTDDPRQAGVWLVNERTDRLLAFDLLERLDHILPAGSPILTLMPKKRAADFGRKLEQHLRKRSVLHSDRHGVVTFGVAGGDPAAWTPRLHEFEASTPTEKVRLCSRPGVFAHARPDAGGLALAESFQVGVGAAKLCGDLSESRQDFAAPTENKTSHPRILELGCGCGLVSLLLAARLQGQAEFVLVDSNARAVECTRRGAELNGFAGIHVEHSDIYQPTPGTFDSVLGNPPYFAGHRIAEYFIEVGVRALKVGGILWLVSKHGDEIDRYATSRGFKVETRHRRGYDISVCRR